MAQIGVMSVVLIVCFGLRFALFLYRPVTKEFLPQDVHAHLVYLSFLLLITSDLFAPLDLHDLRILRTRVSSNIHALDNHTLFKVRAV